MDGFSLHGAVPFAQAAPDTIIDSDLRLFLPLDLFPVHLNLPRAIHHGDRVDWTDPGAFPAPDTVLISNRNGAPESLGDPEFLIGIPDGNWPGYQVLEHLTQYNEPFADIVKNRADAVDYQS